MICTKCEGSGFFNAEQIPIKYIELTHKQILNWAIDNYDHDVSVCDCCGDGDSNWYGIPGEHYNNEDPKGKYGPYADNGGLCKCH